MATEPYRNVVQEMIRRLLHHKQELQTMHESVQSLIEQVEAMEKIVDVLRREVATDIALPVALSSVAYAIADGKRLSKMETETVDEQLFDVVLDIPHQLLKVRQCEQKESRLEACNLAQIGTQRLRILALILSRPGAGFAVDDVVNSISGDEYMEPSSLTRTIYLFRRAMGQGRGGRQYIQTRHRGGAAGRAAYAANPSFRYLVIQRRI